MERKGTKKRQHYVPRFILRNFSTDERNVGVLVLGDGKIVPNGPIKSQAYEDYFYGADQILEDSFSDGEKDIAGRLEDLSDERLAALTIEDLEQLRFFVHYQLFRTRAAVEQANSLATALAQVVVEGRNPAGNDDLKAASLVHEEGGASLFWMATRMVPATHDLEVRILTTGHSERFVIGDHPVALYNQFAEHHSRLKDFGRATGLNAKGLQVLLPISPRVCLLLFDSSTYQMDVQRVLCKVGPKDVRAINQMQAVNSYKALFFDGRCTNESTLKALHDFRATHGSIHETTVVPLGKIDTEEGQGDLLKLTRPDVRVGAHFSFLRVTDRHDYLDHRTMEFPPRNPNLREFLKAHDEVLREEFAKAKEVR